MAWVQSLAWELPYAMGATKKKKASRVEERLLRDSYLGDEGKDERAPETSVNS